MDAWWELLIPATLHLLRMATNKKSKIKNKRPYGVKIRGDAAELSLRMSNRVTRRRRWQRAGDEKAFLRLTAKLMRPLTNLICPTHTAAFKEPLCTGCKSQWRQYGCRKKKSFFVRMQASQSWSGSSASHWGNKADFKQTEALKRAPPVVALHTTTCAKIVVWIRDFWVKHATLKIWFKKNKHMNSLLIGTLHER